MWLCRGVGRWWTATSEVVCALIVEGRGAGGARTRRNYYDGFHVFRDPDVPRVPTNGFTLHCEQLCENYQHVLEHNKFDVSAKFLSSALEIGAVASRQTFSSSGIRASFNFQK